MPEFPPRIINRYYDRASSSSLDGRGQSGKSLAMAVAVLFNALTRKGFRAAIVAPSKRQSLKMVDKISSLLSRLGHDVLEGPTRKGRLVFANRAGIEALPNNPHNMRGE